MITFGFVHRWIEFDQHIAGFDVLSVTDVEILVLSGRSKPPEVIEVVAPARAATAAAFPNNDILVRSMRIVNPNGC